MKIGAGKVVSFDYVLTDIAGEQIGGSTPGEPLVYLHGLGQLITGLESALEGKQKGDKFDVMLQPEQAYGHRDTKLIGEVPRSQFPPDMELKPGMSLTGQTPAGPRVVQVIGVSPTSIKIDANHALAGLVLTFRGMIVDVRDATPEEMQHRHVHSH